MTFVRRLILVIASALTVTLLAASAAAVMSGRKVGEEVELARVSPVLGALRGDAEANLSVGLALDQVVLLQARIEREKINDPSIIAIDIFNPQGRTVYSTDRGAMGEEVDGRWVENLAGDAVWRLAGPGEITFGARFDGDLGLAGGIAVTVSDAGRAAWMEAVGLGLAARLGAILLVAVVSGLLLTLGFAHLLTRPFAHVARILRGGPVGPEPVAPLEILAVSTRDAWTRADARVEQAMRALKEMDDAV